MFKKSLIVSVIFHLLLCAGLELISEDSDNLRVAQRPSTSLMVTLDSDLSLEKPGFLKERTTGDDVQKKPVVRLEQVMLENHREPTMDLNVAEETPPNLLTDSEKVNPEVNVIETGQNEYEAKANDSPHFEASGLTDMEMSGAGAQRQSQALDFQVDQLPVKIYAPNPEYPLQARRNNWEGIVVLKILIETDGLVGKVTVLQSSGYEILDRAAVKAVKRWRYRPALVNGIAVARQAQVRIKFALEDEYAVDN